MRVKVESHRTAGQDMSTLTRCGAKVKSFACWLFVFLFISSLCLAQGNFYFSTGDSKGPLDSDRLFSPSVGRKFYEIAYELVNSENRQFSISDHHLRTEQAMVFLNAAVKLDSRADYVRSLLIKTACSRKYTDHERSLAAVKDNSELIYYLLGDYVGKTADLEVVTEAVRYLLEQFNSREQREKLLEELLKNLGPKNTVLDSELATLLGLLNAEKTDVEAAQSYFMRAYYKNKYNKLAFEKLTELMPEQITPPIYLEHLRLALEKNPLDIEAAQAFAGYARQLELFHTAASAYEYCAELFRFLYPAQSLPKALYFPWALSNYNTQRNQYKCLQIAEQVRQSGRFDLSLEAIAAKAAVKIGDRQQANQILTTAEDKAQANYQSEIASQLAWFYCFAMPDADKAIDWANKAYSMEPNSATAAAILAYSLVINGQTDLAKTLIDNYQRTQISDLALAQIQLETEQRDAAVESLKSAIAAEPGSLEAERAKEILAQLNADYIPAVDPDITLTALRNSLARAVVPAFVRPEKIISAELNVRGSKFSYGSDFGATITITNNSSEPLVISDDGLFNGNIRVDANISGDLNKRIPNLVSVKIRPASPIEPGQSISIPLQLVTGELRRTLFDHPQATLYIEFTGYLDPVTTGEGEPTNRLGGIKPARVVVKHPGVELTAKYLRNRFNSLSKGRQGQKIKTAQFFVGLLMEQHTMAERQPLYKFMYADWMPALLKSALRYNLADDDWTVRVHTMAAMLPLTLDYELINAVAENLDDNHWPVRLTAAYLLAKAQGDDFGKVLDWKAKYDSNNLVRDMTIALGAVNPQLKQPPDKQLPADSNKEPPSS